MNAGPDGSQYPGQPYPYGAPGGQVPPGFPGAGYPNAGYPVAGQPGSYSGYDPVTGQPLPPGPPAYSSVDPYAPPPMQYPPAPGYPGYAPAGYQLVPMYPMVPQKPPKPGGAIAAAVLAFVQAGFVLIGSVFMFSGASFSTGLDGNRYSSELTLVGVSTLIVGGLLIAGGTTMLNRRSALLAIGGLLSIALSVYFAIRLTDFAFGVALWVPIIYAVLPILAIALSMGSEVKSWVRGNGADVR